MNNNQIPVINVGTVPVGPGSQDEGDMVLDYMKMPGAMNTYDMPVLPESDDIKACPQAVLVLEQLQQMLVIHTCCSVLTVLLQARQDLHMMIPATN